MPSSSSGGSLHASSSSSSSSPLLIRSPKRMRLTRRRLKLTRGKIVKMSQERQKLSFFLVVIFLAIFGVIVLAEVLFMEEPRDKEDKDFAYELDTPTKGVGHPPLWPQALKQQQQQQTRNERYQKSLRRHQDEMERLIKTIQSSVAAAAAANGHNGLLPARPPAVRPYNYSGADQLDFDFELTRHKGFDALWQPVNGTVHKFYVYSAYYDGRSASKPVVRVVGATRTKRPEKVLCRFHRKSPQTAVQVPATVSVIRENWNLKYSACFVLCPLGKSSSSTFNSSEPFLPTSVSVIADSKDHGQEEAWSPGNQLPVLNLHRPDQEDDRLDNSTEVGVCVKPAYFNYSKTLELIEFIELNKLLGVTHFTLYNDTIAPETDCVLKHYVDLGQAEVLPWKLDMQSQTEIRTEGLFAALNDCLYRNMDKFRYLMLIDFDEFVMPQQNRTLPEMLAYMDATRRASSVGLAQGRSSRLVVGGAAGGAARAPPASYSFQNAFFYTQFPDDAAHTASAADPVEAELLVLRKTRRKSKFNPQKQRSKYICLPRRVREAGNHFIWEYVDGTNVNVPTTVGFLHHYRVCEFGGDDCVRTDSKTDRTAYRYKKELVANVRAVLERLAGQCGLQRYLWATATPPTPPTSSTPTQTQPTGQTPR